jgi:cysteine desulfurase/selenocysteine lyase
MNDLRHFFPIFRQQKNLVYLDSAATSLKPKTMVKAVSDYYKKYSFNLHSENASFLFKKIKITIQKTRELIALKIKARLLQEIIFFPSATYALNVLALSCRNRFEEKDKICLTYLEHSSNVHP